MSSDEEPFHIPIMVVVSRCALPVFSLIFLLAGSTLICAY
jgi:hypothetical protein